MARTTVRDRVTRLSCRDNMDVEALVTRYCIAIPHVYPIFPEHRCTETRLQSVGGWSWVTAFPNRQTRTTPRPNNVAPMLPSSLVGRTVSLLESLSEPVFQAVHET